VAWASKEPLLYRFR